MNYRRSALGAAVLNGRIYVCGGYDGASSLRTCEVYNPEQNRQVIGHLRSSSKHSCPYKVVAWKEGF